MKKPTGYWTEERCAAEAAKHSTRREFREAAKGAYLRTVREGWHYLMDHMPTGREGRNWSKSEVAAEASKYSDFRTFERKATSAYIAARKNGWYEEVTAHILRKRVPDGYWTKERITAEAAKFDSRSKFQKNGDSAYVIARKNGWLDEVCAHMQAILKKWPEAAVRAEANKYTLRKHFKEQSPSAYDKANILGVMDDVCSHMQPVKPDWTEAEIRECANLYQHRSDFWYHDTAAHKAARRRNILDDVCVHMTPKSARFQNDKPCRLYYLRVETGGTPLYKIGITAQDYRRRYANVNKSRLKRLKFWRFQTGREALDVEQRILKHCAEYRYSGPDVLPNGNTELFTVDILGLDTSS